MPEPTLLRVQPAASPGTSAPPPTYLGPARVVDARERDLLVQLETTPPTQVVATPAFAFPYRATTGDVLLVLGQSHSHFAVGVIAGAHPTTLEFQGDASIHSVHGRLTLCSDLAIELRSPRLTVRTGLLRTIAGSVVEKAGQVRRWVRGLLAVRAGESRRVVDGLDSTRCENSTTLAKHTVKIDGDQLHLGH